MDALAQYLATTGRAAGTVALVTGQVLSWTAAGNNSVTVLGATVPNVRALSGVTPSPGDTLALLVLAGTYLAIGKVV